MEKYKKTVKEYFDKYQKQAVIAQKVDDKIVIASPNIEAVEVVSSKDALKGSYGLIRDILTAKKDINAIIISGQKFTKVVSQTGLTIPPLLDDLAQIVGPTVRCSSCLNTKEILKKLSGRNACLIKDTGALVTGRTLDEADTATNVLEKGAKSFIRSTVIGGTKPIRKFEAILMHIIYKKKYSKIDQTTKVKEMQND